MSKRLGTAVALLALAACRPDLSELPTKRVEIPRGSTLSQVAQLLAATEIIESPGIFKLRARVTLNATAIKAGVYELPIGATSGQILGLLVSGRPATNRLLIPEGLMLREIAAAIQGQLGIPAESVLAAARDRALIESLGIAAENLEGYLYPSTYSVRVGSGALEVVGQMVDEFVAVWRPEWDERAREIGLTRHEVVTLASIIEGEVQYAPDGPFVSSVYHNRLRIGMRLQADPTVIYALGERRRLFERDYSIRSLYNTYLIGGLPPGPIGQPSAASIEASLYPEKTGFFYIVADTSGKHIFSSTLREHSAAVRRVRALRRG